MKMYKQKVLCMQCVCEGVCVCVRGVCVCVCVCVCEGCVRACVCVCEKFCSLDSPTCIPSLLLSFSFPSPFTLLPFPDFSPLLPLSSHRECPKRRVSQPRPVVMYQLRKEYPGSLGKPPHVAVHSVSLAIQRNECFGLLGPNGITAHSHSSSIVASFPLFFHCGLVPIVLPLWPRSHSSSIVASFPFFFHCGLVPILLPLWPRSHSSSIVPRSHSSSIVASFPFFFHCGLVPILLPLWPRSHSSSIVASFPFFFHCGLVPILLSLWPRSHSSFIVALFPFFFHCGLVPILLSLWPHSHSIMVPVSFLFIPIPNAIILEVFLLF